MEREKKVSHLMTQVKKTPFKVKKTPFKDKKIPMKWFWRCESGTSIIWWNLDDYLEWVYALDYIFEAEDFDYAKSFKVANLKHTKYASWKLKDAKEERRQEVDQILS